MNSSLKHEKGSLICKNLLRSLKLVLDSWALAIGFGIAFLIVTGMKGQLKSVYHQTGATDCQENSLQITNAQEFFLYSNVDKKAKPGFQQLQWFWG